MSQTQGSGDLTAFLRARLDEDEATASYAGPACVAWLTLYDGEGRMLYTTVAAGGEGDWDTWVAYGKEVTEPASVRVVYDPARARGEVAAKRQIVTRYEFACQQATVSIGTEQEAWEKIAGALERDVLDLAAIYRDHPDYRPEWKP